MPLDTIYSVAGESNKHRVFVLRDGSRSLAFINAQWGTSLAESWEVPEFVTVKETVSCPEADFSATYVSGLLLTSSENALAIAFPALECLPARVEKTEKVLLNPLVTVTRFRQEGADYVSVPSGAILLLSSADFYAEDIPANEALFWFHDGNAPRFLLCNEGFRSRCDRAGYSGLVFQRLGNAR